MFPKKCEIHLRKTLNILRRRHLIRKLPFLVAYISSGPPGPGGLFLIRPLEHFSEYTIIAVNRSQ